MAGSGVRELATPLVPAQPAGPLQQRPLPCFPPLPFPLGFLGSLGGVKGVVLVRLGGGGVGVLGLSRPL